MSSACGIRQVESQARAYYVTQFTYKSYIAPDKAAYCVFTQFRERENAIKFISVRTKTQ